MKTYKGRISSLKENEIFVFGSNTEGRHGKGAAKIAKDKFGAEYGNPQGLQGNSWAIITKDLTKKTHPSYPKVLIFLQILQLYLYAEQNKEKTFYIAYSGKGENLNGYTNNELANMFFNKNIKVPQNIVFEEDFSRLSGRD